MFSRNHHRPWITASLEYLVTQIFVSLLLTLIITQCVFIARKQFRFASIQPVAMLQPTILVICVIIGCLKTFIIIVGSSFILVERLYGVEIYQRPAPAITLDMIKSFIIVYWNIVGVHLNPGPRANPRFRPVVVAESPDLTQLYDECKILYFIVLTFNFLLGISVFYWSEVGIETNPGPDVPPPISLLSWSLIMVFIEYWKSVGIEPNPGPPKRHGGQNNNNNNNPKRARKGPKQSEQCAMVAVAEQAQNLQGEKDAIVERDREKEEKPVPKAIPDKPWKNDVLFLPVDGTNLPGYSWYTPEDNEYEIIPRFDYSDEMHQACSNNINVIPCRFVQSVIHWYYRFVFYILSLFPVWLVGWLKNHLEAEYKEIVGFDVRYLNRIIVYHFGSMAPAVDGPQNSDERIISRMNGPLLGLRFLVHYVENLGGGVPARTYDVIVDFHSLIINRTAQSRLDDKGLQSAVNNEIFMYHTEDRTNKSFNLAARSEDISRSCIFMHVPGMIVRPQEPQK